MILNQFGKLENVGRSTAEYMRWRELMNATVTRTTAAPADSARFDGGQLGGTGENERR